MTTSVTTFQQATTSANHRSVNKDCSSAPASAFVDSGRTSLLDVLRSQGPAMLAADSSFIRPRHPSAHSNSSNSNSSKCYYSNEKPLRTTSSACSKPIRISPAAGSSSARRYGDRDEGTMSSSAELERFYDQATWRMYMLIQSARLAQERDFGTTAGVPCGHPQQQKHQQRPAFQPSYPHHLQQPQWYTDSNPAAAVSDEEVEMVEEDEAIFDMEL